MIAAWMQRVAYALKILTAVAAVVAAWFLHGDRTSATGETATIVALCALPVWLFLAATLRFQRLKRSTIGRHG